MFYLSTGYKNLISILSVCCYNNNYTPIICFSFLSHSLWIHFIFSFFVSFNCVSKRAKEARVGQSAFSSVIGHSRPIQTRLLRLLSSSLLCSANSCWLCRKSPSEKDTTRWQPHVAHPYPLLLLLSSWSEHKENALTIHPPATLQFNKRSL